VHRHDESGCTTSVIEIEAQVPREAKTFGQVVSYVRRAREKHGHASAFFFQHPEHGIACCYPTAATRQERNRVIPLAKVITPLHQSNIDQAFTNGFVRSVVDDADAEAAWKTALEEGGDTVTQHYTMIAGTLLPIYDRLPDDNPIVYRLTLDDGERLIGRVRYLARKFGVPINLTDSLETLDELLRPHAKEWIVDGPLFGDERFSVQSLLEDIATLRVAGKIGGSLGDRPVGEIGRGGGEAP